MNDWMAWTIGGIFQLMKNTGNILFTLTWMVSVMKEPHWLNQIIMAHRFCVTNGMFYT